MYYTRTINPLNPYRDEKEISLYIINTTQTNKCKEDPRSY